MNAVHQENHQMLSERAVGEDVDEYYCPICGRRMIVQWAPNYKKTILEAGDENAIHTAFKTVVNDDLEQRPAADESSATDSEEQRLDQWEELLQQVNFDPPEADADDWRLEKWNELLDQMNFDTLWQ